MRGTDTAVLAFPARVEGISAAFISEAVSSRYSGVEVGRVQIGELYQGTSSSMPLLIEYWRK